MNPKPFVAAAVLAVLAPSLPAQDPAPDPAPETAGVVYERFVAEHRRDEPDARAAAAKELLAARRELFAAGDGLHYRGRLQRLAGVAWQDVVASYRAHAAARREAALAHDSLVLAAQLMHRPGKDFAGAAKLLEEVERERLSEGCRPTFDSLVRWTASDAAQAALIGEPAPALRPLHVVQGGDGLSLAQLRGKVVLLEYWASW